MIISKAKFNLQIFLISSLAQSATSVDVGSVLREKGLVEAVQNTSPGAYYNVTGLGHCMVFQTKLKVEFFNSVSQYNMVLLTEKRVGKTELRSCLDLC